MVLFEAALMNTAKSRIDLPTFRLVTLVYALKKTRVASRNLGRSFLDFAVFIKAASKRTRYSRYSLLKVASSHTIHLPLISLLFPALI